MTRDDAALARSRSMERAEMREAVALSHVRSSIDRMLGEELIAAGRDVVRCYDDRHAPLRNPPLVRAIEALRALVGRR